MKGIINLNDAYDVDDDYRGGESVNAGSFETGKQYVINNVGDTNWASIGATTVANGAVFTATGAGSGTGTAYKYDGLYKRFHSIMVTNTDHASDPAAYPQYRAWVDGDRNHAFDAGYPFNLMAPFANMTNYFNTGTMTKGDIWEKPLIWMQVTDINTGADITASITGNTLAYPSVFTAVAHGFSNGMLVSLSGLDGSAASLNGQTLYVKVLTADTFELHYNSGLTNPVYFRDQAISQVSSTLADLLNPVTFTLSAPETFYNGERVLASNFNNDYTDMNGNHYYIDEIDSTHVRLYLDAAKTIPYYKVVSVSLDTSIDIGKERSATLTVYIDNVPVIIPDGTEITFNSSTGYGQSTLVGNSYYTKDITGGYFEIYVDQALTTPVTIGDGLDDADLNTSQIELVPGEEYAQYHITQQYYPDGTAIYTTDSEYGLPVNDTLFVKNIGNNKIEIYNDAGFTNKVSDFTNWKFFQKSHIKFDQFNTPYSSPKNPIYATDGVNQYDLTNPAIGAGLFTVEAGTVINTGKYVYQPDGNYFEGITSSDIDALDIVPFNDSDYIIIEDTGWTYNSDPLYRFKVKNVNTGFSYTFADEFVEDQTPQTFTNTLALRIYFDSIYTFNDRKIFSNVFACETRNASNTKIGNYIRMIAGSGIAPYVFVYDTIERAMTGEALYTITQSMTGYTFKTLAKLANDEYLTNVDLPGNFQYSPTAYYINDWAWKSGPSVSNDRLTASAYEYEVYDDHYATPAFCTQISFGLPTTDGPFNGVKYQLTSGIWTPVGNPNTDPNNWGNKLYDDIVNGMTVQYGNIGAGGQEAILIITDVGTKTFHVTALDSGVRTGISLPYKKFILIKKEINGYSTTAHLPESSYISDTLNGATTVTTYNETTTLEWSYDYDTISTSFTDVEWAHCNTDFNQKIYQTNQNIIDFYIMDNDFTIESEIGDLVTEATAGTLNNEQPVFSYTTTGTAFYDAPVVWGVGSLSFESGGNTPFKYRDTDGNYVNGARVKGWWNWDNQFRTFATKPGVTFGQTSNGYLNSTTLTSPGEFGVDWLSEGLWLLMEVEPLPDTYVTPTLSPAELADAFPDTDYWTNTEYDSRKEWPTTKWPVSTKLNMVQPDIATKTLTGIKYVRSGGFTRWQAELNYGPLTRPQFDDFFSFVQEVRGQKHPFLLKMILPNGKNMLFGNVETDTSDVYASAPQTNIGDPIIVEGFDSWQQNVLPKGSVFTTEKNDRNGYANTQIAPGGNANAYGEALIRPAWSMGSLINGGDILFINPSHITVTMAENGFEYTVDRNELYYFSVTFDLDEWK